MKFGIWTTGRDEAAFELLKAIFNAAKNGSIKGSISYIFCNRERGEGVWSDAIISWCKETSVPIVGFSSSEYEPVIKKVDFEEWRSRYHSEVRKLLSGLHEDVRVLVGYMLILDAESCMDRPTINLHPAKPGGPKGTWQEVIWNLIEKNAEESGVMIHLVTSQLDEGPPISYCTYTIKGESLDDLWKEHKLRLRVLQLSEIIRLEGEDYPLFSEIRELGLKREFPLLIHTLKTLSEGNVRVEKGKVMNREGRILKEGYDLTEEIDKVMK